MFPNKINKIIGKALKLAKDNPNKFKLAAICSDKKGNIISSGINSFCTHPYQKRLAVKNNNPYKIYLHAELAAICKAKRKIHSIVVVRVLNNNKLNLAKPCPICMEAIKLANIKVLLYSTQNGVNIEKL